MTEPKSRLPRARAPRGPQGRIDPPRNSPFAEPQVSGRIDPPVQHIDAVSPWGKLENCDAGRHYVFVNQNNKFVGGVSWYRSLGYRVERASPDGVRLAGGGGLDEEMAPGTPLTTMDTVVMSCTKQRKAQLDAYGEDGEGGQYRIDQLEKQIIGSEGVDASRGLYGRIDRDISVENHTESDWQPAQAGA